MSYKKCHLLTVVMKGKISYIDKIHFFVLGCKRTFSSVNLGILTWEINGIDSLLEPVDEWQF